MTTKLTRQNEIYGTYSERFPILYDRQGRVQKANKIVSIMQDFSEGNLSELKVLDIGGSAGVMTEVFAGSFETVVELDIDDVAISRGKEACQASNIDWVCGDGSNTPFDDNSFDCVICNHVYEHLDNQQGLVDEIYRILKPNGFCYFSAGSRFALIEGHYFLPFLSWLPHWLADLYMRVAGREGNYDVKLLSYRNLRKLLKGFYRHDYTIPILKQPKKFAADDLQKQNKLAFKIPTFIYKLFYPILPIWIWILTKK